MSTATIARVNGDVRANHDGDAVLPSPVEDLLDAAAEQGALTFAQVRRALDEAGVGPAEAKRVLRVINDRGIAIGADAPGSVPASPTTITLAEEEGDPDVWDQEGPPAGLVRVYLTDIGRVALLTAEQEVDLAKRIEAGLFAAEKLRA